MSFETTGRRARTRTAIGALTALLMAACGGGGYGGADDGDGQGPTGAIDGGGLRVVSGPINGFGSVIVNGVRYDTSIDLAAETLVVLGQTVLVNAGTSFDDGGNSPVASLRPDSVERDAGATQRLTHRFGIGGAEMADQLAPVRAWARIAPLDAAQVEAVGHR